MIERAAHDDESFEQTRQFGLDPEGEGVVGDRSETRPMISPGRLRASSTQTSVACRVESALVGTGSSA